MVPLVKTNLTEAVGSLLSSKQRSVLALIGITIGIGSVIAMISVGTIVKGEAVKQFRRMGTDILTIQNISEEAGARRGSAVTIDLADALEVAAIPSIDASAPYMSSPGQASFSGKTTARVHIVGVTAAFGELAKLDVEEGRFISDLDHRRYYCVIGSEIAATMRGAGDRRIVGETIKIDDVVYTVVGVLRSGLRGPREFTVGRAVLIPISTAQRVLGYSDIRRIVARTKPNAHYLTAMAEVSTYFRRKSRDLVVRVESPKTLIEQMHKQMRLFTLLLGAVGGISLLVGGIGVMNVMLISVTERRLEIGIRRALGARRRDIQWQFLIESLILSLLGGVVGIGLGIGATYVICQFTSWTFLVPLISIGLGVGVASAVGLFFGYYPAWQAARLDPIAALRGK